MKNKTFYFKPIFSLIFITIFFSCGRNASSLKINRADILKQCDKIGNEIGYIALKKMPEGSTIAVFPFDYERNGPSAYKDYFTLLGDIAEDIYDNSYTGITRNNLFTAKNITAIDESVIAKAIKELKIHNGDLFDNNGNIQKLGKFIGAEIFIVGKVLPRGKDIKVQIKIINIVTLKVIASESYYIHCCGGGPDLVFIIFFVVIVIIVFITIINKLRLRREREGY